MLRSVGLVLAVGVTYSSLFGGNQPSAQELEFGQQVVNHVYMELDEIDSKPEKVLILKDLLNQVKV